MKNTRHTGFTLIEVAVAMSLTMLVLLAILASLQIGTSFLDRESRSVELENRAQVVLARLARELKDASAQSVSASANQVSFQPCLGYDSEQKSLKLGPAVTYQIKPGSAELVRRVGAAETVICRRAKSLNVSAFGSRRAVITLLLERAGQPADIRREFLTSIWIANP